MWKYDENGNWVLVPDTDDNPSNVDQSFYPANKNFYNDDYPEPLEQPDETSGTICSDHHNLDHNLDHKSDHNSSPFVLHWQRPLVFYIVTWLSTTFVGAWCYGNGSFLSGLWFSVPLMLILTCHELGHYIQSMRYHVHSSLPFFIPVPLPPFGTFGAVIQMDSQIPNIKALFDIGISGPLAGLLPTLIFMVIGIYYSTVGEISENGTGLVFGEPFLFRWVSEFFFDRSQAGTDLIVHPIAMAAWTGLFITSLNLFPLGQLDGGHVFYALLKKKAALFSFVIFSLIVFFVVFFQQWSWILMIILILFFGLNHPPTCNDSIKLGGWRTLLGWLTLAFIFIGFTPNPISEIPVPPEEETPRSKTIYSLNDREYRKLLSISIFTRNMAGTESCFREGVHHDFC